MKKIIMILFGLILLSGCNDINKYEEEMQTLSNKYYTNYIKGKVLDLNYLEIKISDLKKVGIQLNNLKKCEEDSKIILKIEKDKIISYDFDLKC